MAGDDAPSLEASDDDDAGPAHWFDRGPRAARVVFAVVVAAAVPLYLVAGRDQWFYLDEWEFLVARDGGSVDSLLSPHNEHWTTVPIWIYRLLFNVVGLRSYVPYQLLSIGTHVAITVLLYAVIRRSVTSPWIATAAATAFAFFGSGFGNIVWGFQVAFAGAIAWGLAQLLLADHDDRSVGRDLAGLGCGLIGLASSGPATTMVFVVGLAMLLRHGWRRAAVHTIPLAVIYLVWLATYGRSGYVESDSAPLDVLRFAWIGARKVGFSLAVFAPLVLVLVALIVGGFVLIARAGVTEFRQRGAIPLSMLVGAGLFFCVAGYGRAAAFGPEFAERSRYTHLGAALLLPALALGVDQVCRQIPRASPVLVALLLIGVPGNVRAIDTLRTAQVPRGLVIELASSQEFEGVPDELVPFRREAGARELTMGWLRKVHSDGELPGTPKAFHVRKARERFTLYVDPARRIRGTCRTLPGPVSFPLDAGESFGFSGVVLIGVTVVGADSLLVGRGSPKPVALVAGRGPLSVRVSPFRGRPAQLCR